MAAVSRRIRASPLGAALTDVEVSDEELAVCTLVLSDDFLPAAYAGTSPFLRFSLIARLTGLSESEVMGLYRQAPPKLKGLVALYGSSPKLMALRLATSLFVEQSIIIVDDRATDKAVRVVKGKFAVLKDAIETAEMIEAQARSAATCEEDAEAMKSQLFTPERIARMVATPIEEEE